MSAPNDQKSNKTDGKDAAALVDDRENDDEKDNDEDDDEDGDGDGDGDDSDGALRELMCNLYEAAKSGAIASGCGICRQNRPTLFVNIGKDVHQLKFIPADDTSYTNVTVPLCQAECLAIYMNTFNMFLPTTPATPATSSAASNATSAHK